MMSFLCSFQGFPQVQYSCRTLQMLKAPNMDPQNTGLVFLNHKKGEPNDAQTTRRFTQTLMVGVVQFWHALASGFQTFYTSPQSRSYPCLSGVVPHGFMVYLDPGARYMVYLQPQQRMVPSKSPLQSSNQNGIFSFHKSLFKKALLSHFLANKGGTPE